MPLPISHQIAHPFAPVVARAAPTVSGGRFLQQCEQATPERRSETGRPTRAGGLQPATTLLPVLRHGVYGGTGTQQKRRNLARRAMECQEKQNVDGQPVASAG